MKDAVKAGILDLYLVKHWAIKFATDAAVAVLRVDQVREHICVVPSYCSTKFSSLNPGYTIIFVLIKTLKT